MQRLLESLAVTNRFQLVIEVDACDGSVLMPMHVCPLLVAVASDVEERSVRSCFRASLCNEHSSWRLMRRVAYMLRGAD